MYFQILIYGRPLFNGTGYTENRIISIENVQKIEKFLSNFLEIEEVQNNVYYIQDIELLKIKRKVKLYNLSGEKNLNQLMYLNLTNLLFSDSFNSFEYFYPSYNSTGTSGTSGCSGTSTLLDRFEKILRLKFKKYNSIKPKANSWYLNKYERKERFIKV